MEETHYSTRVCLGQAVWLDNEWAVKYAKKEKNLTSPNIQCPGSYGNSPWWVTKKKIEMQQGIA